MDYYRKGRNYEIFICRAFNCNRGRKYGADRDLMIELFILELENKDSFNYTKSLYKRKINIEKALYKLKKRKRYYNSQDEFMPLLLLLSKVKNADDLTEVSTKGLAKIIECENRLRESG